MIILCPFCEKEIDTIWSKSTRINIAHADFTIEGTLRIPRRCQICDTDLLKDAWEDELGYPAAALERNG